MNDQCSVVQAFAVSPESQTRCTKALLQTLVSRRCRPGTVQGVRTMYAAYWLLIVGGIVLYLVVTLAVE